MQPLGTKVYLLKRYSPSDSFRTVLSESEGFAYSQFEGLIPDGVESLFLYSCLQHLSLS